MVKNKVLLIRLPYNKNINTIEFSNDFGDSIIGFHSFDKHFNKIFKGKIVDITKDEINKLNITNKNLAHYKDYIHNIRNDYLRDVDNVVNILEDKKTSKVVISRRKWVDFPNDKSIDLGRTFLNLCADYPFAFVHLLVDKDVAWIGATPEILGKYNRASNIFETMSLAGTLPVSETWSNKEIEEQKPVSEYIRSVLDMFSGNEKLEESLVYDYISADIKHLCKDFKVKITKEKVSELIDVLHPTPAVCGFPKDLCMEIIKNTEKYDRKLYSGYIHIDDTNTYNYYVNLRCAQIYKNGVILYAGGGITKHSNAEKEWTETELKMDAVLKRIHLTNND